MPTDLDAARSLMQQHEIHGWLTKDYRYSNPIFFAALGSRPPNLTRPVWLWIPADSRRVVVAHEVDVNRFEDSSVRIISYSNRDQMLRTLRGLLPKVGGKVAMDYSPMCELPRVARADAGSVEMVRSFGSQVVSSGDIIQFATERWNAAQLASHRYAMGELLETMQEAFQFAGENVRWKISEHDVAEFIRGKFDRAGLIADEGPVVAFNANSSDPHYEPRPDSSAVIRRDGWLLIDAWAKAESIAPFHAEGEAEDASEPVYADITWVAKIGAPPTPQQQEVFESVRRGRDRALHFIGERHRQGKPVQGWEADRIARESIRVDGYADYFVHRLGHSLGVDVHSNAVNLDDWESHDTRTLIPGIAVTIEPGIYLPEFGVRLEIDIYISESDIETTGEIQNEIVHIQI